MPKLSLRDLFAVMTIVALALGWWADRSRLRASTNAAQRDVRFLATMLEEEGREVTFTASGAVDVVMGQ